MNWPQINGDLWTTWKKIQTKHLKEAQWKARKHRQQNKIRKTKYEQNGNFNKETKIIKNIRNSGAEEYHNKNERFNRELQHTQQ